MISLQKRASAILRLVKSLRNLSTPAGRLPGEVLEKILEMRCLEQDLIRASHVCRRWRATLVSTPRLWTRVRCVDVARTLQYLARSEPVPINVIVDSKSNIRAVIALGSATGGFRSLTLQLQPFDLLRVFRRFATPAPALERLEIFATRHPQCASIRPLPFEAHIPAGFLGGSAPALKSLKLNRINANLTFSEFPALTHLTLITKTQIFELSELFRVFTSAKLLEEVSIQFSGPTSPTLEDQGVITLPCMKRLSFSNTAREFPKRLLDLLVVPSVEKVKLDINLPGEDIRTMRDFLPTQLQNFPHLLEVDSLDLDVPRARCNIQFGGPGGVISVHASRSGTQEQEEGFHSHWLESIDPMSIADVRDLTLRSYNPVEPLDRCPVFKSLGTLDALRSLVVQKCNNTAVIEVLSPKGSVPFPHLESLTFQLITEPIPIFPDLTGMARARGQMGSPLNEVSSDKHATFRRSDVDALRCYVNCVKLNTRADSPPNELDDVFSYSIVTVRVFTGKYPSSCLCLSLIFFVPHFKRIRRQPRRTDLVGSRRNPCRRGSYQTPTKENALSWVGSPRCSHGDDPRKGPTFPRTRS